ncbi:MAG TPA: hypothetical protein PL155_06760 [Candidatus Omnitrophota bacterium]|nr:hypothetical protein [Candidatus Omnitrophota bacterium]HPD85591.1 hypothetical protein [Candidatus Omnitrophota bacterium]HRZ04369.1 hypothetical protein [Candidatus Omnitrophota bacterium]
MRKFFLKGILLTGLVFCAQAVWPGKVDIPNEIKLLDFALTRGADVIYLGDSAVNWSAASDANDSSMPALLALLVRPARVVKVTHAAYQTDVFDVYSRYVVRKGYRPGYVVVPVNMRSFSPEWDLQPLWQFDRERIILNYKDTPVMKFMKPLSVFKIFEPRISQFAYEYAPVFDGTRYLGRVRDFDNPGYYFPTDENVRKKLMFRFLYTLTPRHRKIQSLLDTVRTLKAAGIQPIVYVTPLDYQTIEKYLGTEFRVRLRDNVAVLRSLLEKEGVDLFDFSTALSREFFGWVEDSEVLRYPNEHLRLKGRMFVVYALAENTALKALISNKKTEK